MVLNGPRLRAVFHCARDGPRFHRHSARGSRCRLRRKDRQPICMQRNAVRYRLSHACFARHDAVPIRRGFSLVRCRAGARRLRAQGIQRRATGDDAARTGGGHGPEQEFGAALHAYALDLGLPAQDPASKKFSLGPWSLELGMKYVQTSPLVLGGNPFLHSLNRNCQETCSLAEPDGGHGVRGAFRHAQGNVREHAGRHAPAAVLHGGGARGAVAAGSDVAHGLLERSDRRSHTAATITGMDALLAELEFARRHGYARSNGEFYRATSPSAPPCWMPAASPGRGQCVGSIQPLVVRTGAGRVWSAGGRNRACHQRVAHLGTFLSLLRAGASRRRAARHADIRGRRSLISVRRTAGPRRRGGPPSGACAAYSILF